MPHFGTPEEAASPVVGGETRERADEVAKLVFVGGTGRSGTHVLSQLLSRHNRYGLVPVEVRFHTDPDGFPGLLDGSVTPEQFVRRLRGLLVEGLSDHALPRHVPLRRARALRRRGGAVRGRPRRPPGRLPAAVLRPALVPDRRGGPGGRGEPARGGPGRAEHRHGRRRPDPGAPLPRGALPARRPRRARRVRLPGGADARPGEAAHAVAGDRVVGGADRRDRGRRRRDRRGPAADREPRRARPHRSGRASRCDRCSASSACR